MSAKLQEQIDLLRLYNVWRRGSDDEKPEPRAIGKALDAVLDALETDEALIRKLDETEVKLENGSQLWQVFTDASDPEMTLREAIAAWEADE